MRRFSKEKKREKKMPLLVLQGSRKLTLLLSRNEKKKKGPSCHEAPGSSLSCSLEMNFKKAPPAHEAPGSSPLNSPCQPDPTLQLPLPNPTRPYPTPHLRRPITLRNPPSRQRSSPTLKRKCHDSTSKLRPHIGPLTPHGNFFSVDDPP